MKQERIKMLLLLLLFVSLWDDTHETREQHNAVVVSLQQSELIPSITMLRHLASQMFPDSCVHSQS
jgi:hypothetical protein